MNQPTPENTNTVPVTNNKSNILSKLNLSPKKIKIGIIIAIVVIAILYLNSASFLRTYLQFGAWYKVYRFDEETQVGDETKFYPDGEALTADSRTDEEWEILDDKTLIYDGTYYDYGEWYCLGWKLIIGDDDEFTRFPWLYSYRWEN